MARRPLVFVEFEELNVPGIYSPYISLIDGEWTIVRCIG